MGDRVDVTFTVLSQQAEKAVELFNTLGWNTEIYQEDGGFSEIMLNDVNYADIDDEAALLREHGIPFQAFWPAGGSYSSGAAWLRFTEDGEATWDEYHDEQETSANYARDLLQNIKQGLDMQGVIKHLTQTINEVEVPEWENQLDYSKRYQLRKLVVSE